MITQNTLFDGSDIILSVTGHRPNKIGGYSEGVFANLCSFARTKLMDIKPTKVMLGMALGWDQAVAIACIDLEIPFEAHMVRDQASAWNAHQKARFDLILERTQERFYHGDPDTKGYMKRNYAMVDRSNTLLSLFNGNDDGGTAATVRYARSRGKTMVNCWDDWVKWNM